LFGRFSQSFVFGSGKDSGVGVVGFVVFVFGVHVRGEDASVGEYTGVRYIRLWFGGM